MPVLSRLKIRGEDWLRHSRFARSVLSRSRALKDTEPARDDSQAIARSIAQLCAAARLSNCDSPMKELERTINKRIGLLNGARFDWSEFVPKVNERRLEKAAILKPWICEREKGVVFISYDTQWIRLLVNANMKEFAKRYTLILSPAWSPPHSIITCLSPAIFPDPIYTLISNEKDLTYFPRISNNYIPVPLFASSWVNPQWYTPVTFEKKDIDIFMLANFAKYKRHWVLFDALRDMPASVRVLLIGQADTRTREDLLAEARAFGAQDRFELVVNAPDKQVFEAFSRSKISVILSRREGSCVAVAESMFANTPVGILEDAEIGSRVFINEQTGRFLQHHNLGIQLMDFITEAQRYSPREWAEQNISCFKSTKTLNNILKKHMVAAGQEWTQDIAVLQWRPDPQLVDSKDKARIEASYDDIQRRFGIDIKRS
jgi:glycosyltransferase involved in cell wall biosynthesis